MAVLVTRVGRDDQMFVGDATALDRYTGWSYVDEHDRELTRRTLGRRGP
jgi:hypothetical protein